MGMTIEEIIRLAPVMPVLVIDDLDDAVPLAKALYAGGLPVLEITLRTKVAAEAIALIREALPDAVVGAGTVTNEANLDLAIAHGAAFSVSPGTTESLITAALAREHPMLPGVATPSEAMVLFEKGIRCMKFFPAEAAGGVPMLKSIYGPLPGITFCPTGGLTYEKAPEYLALPNVACVGGSWMAPKELLERKAWQEIESIARQAATTLTISKPD